MYIAIYTYKKEFGIDSKCLGIFSDIRKAFRTVIAYLINNKIIWYNLSEKVKYYHNKVEKLLKDSDTIFDITLTEDDIVSGYFTTEDVIINHFYFDLYSKYPKKGEELSSNEYIEKIIDIITKSLFNNEDDLIKWCKENCSFFNQSWNISITEELVQ